MIRQIRRLEVPELEVSHEEVELRTPRLWVGVRGGRNVATDYGLVQRASPFVHHLLRPQLVLLLDGVNRFDEAGRRTWLEPGSAMWSDTSLEGTDAFGPNARWIVLQWDSDAFGAGRTGASADVSPIPPVDRERLVRIAAELSGSRPADALDELIRLIRSLGIPIGPWDRQEPEAAPPDPAAARILATVDRHLDRLDGQPAIVELADALGVGERQVHRRIGALARRYHLPYAHWRDALQRTRLLTALRLLAAPGATTERVARLVGFRSPAALCHAFHDRGLPSPGALAHAARADVLDRWAGLR